MAEPGALTIHGIIAYPVTPFTAEGDVDARRLAALVDRLVCSGVHAIAALGSTGELAYLDEAEFDTAVDTAVAAVSGRLPVVLGVSDVTTAKTIRRARYAQHVGADAVMILPVSYWKLNEHEIFQHYRSVGDAITIPIMAYNNPATSGVDMRPELLVRMFESIDNLTMVKESTGDLSRMRRIAELSGGRLPFYNGSNPLVLDALKVGAAGWCTAAQLVAPAMHRSVRSGARRGSGEGPDSLRRPQAAAGVHRRGRAGHHGESRSGAARIPGRGSAPAVAAARRARTGQAGPPAGRLLSREAIGRRRLRCWATDL